MRLVLLEELAPGGFVQPVAIDVLTLDVPPEGVVVEVAGGDEDRHQRGVEEQLLDRAQRAEPDEVPGGRGQVVADLEAPVLGLDVDVADDVHLVEAAGAQAALVGHPDVLELEGLEAHHLGGHGVNGGLVGRGQHQVLAHGDQGSRAGTVADGGAVHHAEQAGVDFPLDGQQVDEGLVDPGVGVVAPGGQQAAEGVLHRPGGGGVDMALDRGQVDDILAVEVVGEADALGEDAVEDQHLGLGLVDLPGHVVAAEVEQQGDAVLLVQRTVLVVDVALLGDGDHGLVLDGHQVAAALAGPHGLDDPLELPGGGVGRGHRQVPGDVVLEDGGLARRQGLFVLGEAHRPGGVLDDGFGFGLDDGDGGAGHDALLTGKRGGCPWTASRLAHKSSPAKSGFVTLSPVQVVSRLLGPELYGFYLVNKARLVITCWCLAHFLLL